MDKNNDKKNLNPGDLGESLKKLDAIASWFDSRREVDVEEGLKKVREGAGLIVQVKSRLKEIENEFEEIKREMKENEGEEI